MKKLLVVDDSKFMRAIIKKSVEDMNLEIFEGSSVDEAIEVLKNEKIDVMTLDITMEEKSGADYIEEFKSLQPEVKIFVCSSMTSSEMIEKVLSLGAYDFIKKPFKNDVLRAKLGEVLE